MRVRLGDQRLNVWLTERGNFGQVALLILAKHLDCGLDIHGVSKKPDCYN